MRIFGKKDVHGKRRMGVVLAKADNIENAKQKVEQALKFIKLD